MTITNDLLDLRGELIDLVRATLADEGTHVDTGGGLGQADIWFKRDGVEYLMTVQKSGAQIEREKLGRLDDSALFGTSFKTVNGENEAQVSAWNSPEANYRVYLEISKPR